MLVKKRCEVQIWRASPIDVSHAQWRALTKSLDLSERSVAFGFRFEVDRKAYVLAHGLRRLALALLLDVHPDTLVFRDDRNGQPQLIKPIQRRVYFSHSHTRAGALFAVSSDAAVGVDAECDTVESGDVTLATPFGVVPEFGEAQTVSSLHYWTALEAVWKAAGAALSADHPRLRLSAHPLGHWIVAFDAPHGSVSLDLATHAAIFPVTSPPGCVASLAIICQSASDTAAFVIHEKELKRDAEQMRRFFMAGSAVQTGWRAS